MAATQDAGKNGMAAGMSTATFLIVVTGLTVLAAGAGFFGGLQILSNAGVGAHSASTQAAPAAAQGSGQINVKVMAPIVTNLAGSRAWIRIESSLVFAKEVPEDAEALSARIAEDIVAYLRTLTVEQIEGASGFQYLSDDLNDRVRVRSNGRVRELVIQGLIIE
jgi:flagellar FliL protein